MGIQQGTFNCKALKLPIDPAIAGVKGITEETQRDNLVLLLKLKY